MENFAERGNGSFLTSYLSNFKGVEFFRRAFKQDRVYKMHKTREKARTIEQELRALVDPCVSSSLRKCEKRITVAMDQVIRLCVLVTATTVSVAWSAPTDKTENVMDTNTTVRRNTRSSHDRRWPGGILFYRISDGFSEQQLGLIREAQNLIVSRSGSCITFREDTTGQIDYLEITKVSSGCGSTVGRQGGVQYLSLAEECFAAGYGIIAHEMMHVLGFLHEHVREDRNSYIIVHEELIAPDKLSEFQILPVETFGTDYDYDSILHYPRKGFGITGTEETITPRDPSASIGQRDHLSNGDVARIRAYYECGMKG